MDSADNLAVVILICFFLCFCDVSKMKDTSVCPGTSGRYFGKFIASWN